MFDCCWLDVININMWNRSKDSLKVVSIENSTRKVRAPSKIHKWGLVVVEEQKILNPWDYKNYFDIHFFIQTEHLFKIFDTSAGLDEGSGHVYSRSLPIDRTNLASQNKNKIEKNSFEQLNLNKNKLYLTRSTTKNSKIAWNNPHSLLPRFLSVCHFGSRTFVLFKR